MSLPYPAFLALAATLTLQVAVLAWIFHPPKAGKRLVRVFLIVPGMFWFNQLRGRKS